MARRRKNATRRNTKAYSLAGVWLTLGIFLGIGAMALAYTFYSNHPPQYKVAKNIQEPRVSKTETSQNKNQKFEFYTKLKDSEVEPSKHSATQAKSESITAPTNVTSRTENTKTTTTKTITTSAPMMTERVITPPTTKTETASKTAVANTKSTLKLKTNSKQKTNAHYIVQAGIFQDLKAADALKATLTLQGFAPIIQTVQTNEGKTWFRVTLGPFPVESLALHQKKRLETYQVRGILILQRPNI